MQRIPSFRALRALVSFARYGTIWQAAEELNLTRSAVSHQLRMLEQELNFPLINRTGNKLELSPAGLSYAADVRNALIEISSSATRNRQRGVSGTLIVSAAPTFAASWLCPRIAKFNDKYPDVSVSVVVPARIGDVSRPDVDVFISYGAPTHSEMEVDILQHVASTPLCSPVLLNRMGGTIEPASVHSAGLLHLADYDDWEQWFQLAGLDPQVARQGIVFSDMYLVYAAAQAGQGIAMGDVLTCREALRSGKLICPFDISIKSPKSYVLAIPQARAEIPAVMAFREWVHSEREMSA